MTEEQLRTALRRAYIMGQTYWQQADSESYSQNRKSDETAEQFRAFVEETATQMREYRNAALEDAVTEIERHADLHIEDIVAAIRALKEHTQQVINDPAEIRRVFEIDEADYPPPDSGFAKL